MTVNYQDLGLRVRDARKAKHLTQEQLAEKVGISSSFMGHIERGTRIASIDTLVSVCNVLSVSPCLLLGASLSENAGSGWRDTPPRVSAASGPRR